MHSYNLAANWQTKVGRQKGKRNTLCISVFLLSVLLFPICLPTLSVSWQPSYNCAFVSSDASCTYGPSRHSISECQEKQTPVPRPFLGPGQSVVSRRIWSVCNSCSVQPSSIVLFSARTLCWVSWYPWWSDALTHQSSRPSNFIEMTIKYS